MMAADELVDIVDEGDHVIGVASRAEVRAQNLRHRAAYILVFDSQGRLFVHQRTPQKDVYPGWFDVTAGGVVGAGESYDAAARRELAEELGITGALLRPLLRFQFADAGNRVNGVLYSCTHDGPLRLQEDEIAGGEWLDLDVVFERIGSRPFCPDGVEALRLYLDLLERVRARDSSGSVPK
jgi:isopentenyldiphosphate isomerase